MLYIGMNNEIALKLYSAGRRVNPNTLTRATIEFGDGVFLDTDVDSELSFSQNNQQLILTYSDKLGTEPQTFPCKLTCYDDDTPDGLAWDTFNIELLDW